MSKIHNSIMFYLDRHTDGEELTWKGYDNLIKLILKEHANQEYKLVAEITKLKKRVINLKEAMC